MAIKGRKDGSQTNVSGKGTFRFRYMDSNRQFEVTADNVDGENLLEGFRHVANAISGRTIAAPAPKLLKTPAGGGAPTEVLEDKEEEVVRTGTLQFPENPADEREEEEEETQALESTPKPKRKPKAPKVLTDINLTTAKVSLADFMQQKGNPTEMMDKYSAVAVWCKQEFTITDMTIDRIFTAFKHLGWESQLPTDVEKPLKNLTYQKQWFQKAKAPGAYEIIWTGEDAVNKMGAAKTA
jgi:hypothetical protein